MPTKIKTDKVAETITPLAQKVAQDPELREHAKNIAESAKKIYEPPKEKPKLFVVVAKKALSKDEDEFEYTP